MKISRPAPVSIFALAVLGSLLAGEAAAAPVVVAGSHLISPPPFLANSFWGATARIDRAFPFTVIEGGPWALDELHVVAFRYALPTGATAAEFTLHTDNEGLPGARMATFALNNIPTTPQVLTMAPLGGSDVLLDSNTPYWVVGGTAQGQLNWNLSNNEFGKYAYHVEGEGWTVGQFGNLSAFAILATAVPEPSGLILAILAAMAYAGVRRRCGKLQE